jgi:hypothetical protein
MDLKEATTEQLLARYDALEEFAAVRSARGGTSPKTWRSACSMVTTTPSTLGTTCGRLTVSWGCDD